ncbi:ubiquitin carboxyl-terminal hydrolase MINDY-1-like [Clytia hemisphaerica]|uniref:Ubiquitin carboxyl-terminal hydrolase n=1 Tax=Clytia hemisphaerica TaxID=252671 RepID=A0A7M5UU06_9CNID
MESDQNNAEEVSTGGNENMDSPPQVSTVEPTQVKETNDKSPPQSASAENSVEDRNDMSIDESSVLSSDGGTMDQSMESQKTNTSMEEVRDSPSSDTTQPQGDVVDGENVEKNDEPVKESSNVPHTEDTTETTVDDSDATTKLEPAKQDDDDIVQVKPDPPTDDSSIETSTSASQQQSISAPRDQQQDSIYHLKWFDWKGIQTPIITQNENGPCPLLGIANVLILARKIELPPMQQIISGKQLMEYIGDCILSSAPEQDRDNEELILNYQQNMQDAIDIMYKLQTGIDVNVKFTGVVDFEFTRECIVFDLLKIALYHGWMVDPQDEPAVKAIHNLSYNQIVEKMLTAKESTYDNVLSEGLAIEDFLSRTASQLTYHGLCELNNTVQEEELCVFFRNNHFSTLYKHKGELFLLVTDQGFLTEPAVIWETLVNIEGDGQFVNSEYRSIQLDSNTVPPAPQAAAGANTAVHPSESKTSTATMQSNLSQEDQDYLIALSLQQQDGSSPVTQPKFSSDDSSKQQSQQSRIDQDHALALQLQEDEDRRARLEQQQQQQQGDPQQAQGNPPPPQQPQGNPLPQQSQQPSSNQRPPQGNSGSQRLQEKDDKCVII